MEEKTSTAISQRPTTNPTTSWWNHYFGATVNSAANATNLNRTDELIRIQPTNNTTFTIDCCPTCARASVPNSRGCIYLLLAISGLVFFLIGSGRIAPTYKFVVDLVHGREVIVQVQPQSNSHSSTTSNFDEYQHVEWSEKFRPSVLQTLSQTVSSPTSDVMYETTDENTLFSFVNIFYNNNQIQHINVKMNQRKKCSKSSTTRHEILQCTSPTIFPK